MRQSHQEEGGEETMFARKKLQAVGLLLVQLAAGPAAASAILYDVTSLGGNTWRYDYTLANDSLTLSVDEFTIYFQNGLFESLRSPVGLAPWDVLAINPDPVLPADGFFDGLVFDLNAALAPGTTLGGFSVEFDYLGSGLPGSQFFQFLTASLEVLDTGFTELVSAPPTGVPEPGTVLLIVSGLLLLTVRAVSRRTR
jgi:hypothetical protein